MIGAGSACRLSSLGFRERNSSCPKIGLFMLLGSLCAWSTPTWKAPAQLKLGELQTLELREEDPLKAAPGRPALEDRLGPLYLRAMDPLPDGRGWRLQVQALSPGTALVPSLDLGDGQRSPELRLQVPRSSPFRGPWVGFGGGNDDRLPVIPFPWGWASLLLLPPAALLYVLGRRWGRTRGRRRFRHAAHTFRRQWPPQSADRDALDAAHALGRDLLAARFGESARAWGSAEFRTLNLTPWDQWVRSLDAARFGRTEPPFPAADVLLTALDARSGSSMGGTNGISGKGVR